ncbi:MAG: DNA polymerase/3'-5' exonuclease PolX [Solirubrobacterales bacterium]
MRNSEIATSLRELGVLYELDGADRFRVLAYKEAARTARDCPLSLEQMAADGRLTELPGVGKTMATKIEALLEDGEIPSAVKLKKKFPASLVEVTRVPGLGAKTARRLYDELGIEDLDGLQAAAEEHAIRELKGLGAKAEERILAALEGMPETGDEERRRLSAVLPVARELAADLAASGKAGRVEVAGSARRWGETCKDIDLVATAADPKALVEAFIQNNLLAEERKGGDAGAQGLTHTGIKVDLRIVPEENFGNLLQHFTGSAEHNVELRERALGMGYSVSENGIVKLDAKKKPTKKVHRFTEEAGVYELLGLPLIPPELREGRGEIDAADSGELPELVRIEDIKGDLHSHTTLSDGRNSLEEMAAAARKRGYAYLAITDHSASHGFGNDVTAKQLSERIEEVRAFNKGKRGFRLLAGSEVNIGTDGSLDYPDELLAELDWVIASVHTSFQISEKKMTNRVVAAIEHPHVDCIGHLTGRQILSREPYAIDVEKVAEAAARTGTMLEINGNPRRRDLSEHHARIAAEAGAAICVNTDAHGTDTLDNLQYGIATARRAWLSADQIANTRGWREFSKLRKRANS